MQDSYDIDKRLLRLSLVQISSVIPMVLKQSSPTLLPQPIYPR